MNLETFREYCLTKDFATEDMPFDETTLVFRIGGKIFALTDLERMPFRCNLKAEPERVVELCESYPEITPGYHMSKKHWVSVEPLNDFDRKLFFTLVDDSYDLVFKSLPKSIRESLKK